MEALHWDLTRTATRQYLRDTLFAQLDAEQTAEITKRLDALGWGEGHFHGVIEVHAALRAAGLPAQVEADALAIYDILAQAEAAVHGVPVEQTHFHEVGNAEAVRSVLAICLAIRALAPFRITATPVQTGSGTVKCAHGVLDIPAPATAAILARGIPTCAQTVPSEQCTPTSAAIIAYFVEEFEPPRS